MADSTVGSRRTTPPPWAVAVGFGVLVGGGLLFGVLTSVIALVAGL